MVTYEKEVKEQEVKMASEIGESKTTNNLGLQLTCCTHVGFKRPNMYGEGSR